LQVATKPTKEFPTRLQRAGAVALQNSGEEGQRCLDLGQLPAKQCGLVQQLLPGRSQPGREKWVWAEGLENH
jgi:hypothetical protein